MPSTPNEERAPLVGNPSKEGPWGPPAPETGARHRRWSSSGSSVQDSGASEDSGGVSPVPPTKKDRLAVGSQLQRFSALTRRSHDADQGTVGCLVALRFEDRLLAQEALLAALRLQRNGKLRLDDAAIVSHGPFKRVRITQTRDINPLQGATAGSWVGLVAGLLLNAPLAGIPLGAVLGGLWAYFSDLGIADDEMRRLGQTLRPEQAALFLLILDAHRTHVFAEARRFNATVLHHTLSGRDHRDLLDALGNNTKT